MKKNFEKMLAEYDKLGDRKADLHYSFHDFADLISFMEDDAKTKHLYGDKSYVVNVHPIALVSRAFEIGYVAALRKVKADEGRKRRADRQEKLDDLMKEYTAAFGEGFPSFQLFRGRHTQDCIDMVERCLREHKNAYDLGYVTDEKGVLY